MHILGKTEDGINIDLKSLVETACSNPTRLKFLYKKFLIVHPEWKDLAQDAARKYKDDLLSIQIDQGTIDMAKHLGTRTEDVQLANRISLLILFGYSHYLKSADFDLKDPTDFHEVTGKLLYARNAIAKIGFGLVVDRKEKREEYSLSTRDQNYYEEGFCVGGALGYITQTAHLKGLKLALSLLESNTRGN